MNDKDLFALSIAAAMLRADDDDFSAAALTHIAERASQTQDLESLLAAATKNEKRPGDMGLEFIEPFLPVVLVHFGQILWDAYVKEITKQGAKALSDLSLKGVKALFKRTLSSPQSAVSLADIEARLKQVALQEQLSDAQTDKLLASLRGKKLITELEEEPIDGSG